MYNHFPTFPLASNDPQTIAFDHAQAAHDTPDDHCAQPAATAPAQKAHLAKLADNYLAALLRSDRESAARIIMEAVNGGVDVRDIYLHVFQPSQYEVGRLWQTNEISVAQEHFCTAATQMIMTDLYPQIFSTERNGRAMVAACIGSERHEIGIRMIADFFEMDGWDSYYLGTNVDPQEIIATLLAKEAAILALSATMSPSVGDARTIIEAVRADARVAHVLILVGGAGFHDDPHAWTTTGADGYAVDAQGAVATAKMLIGLPT